MNNNFLRILILIALSLSAYSFVFSAPFKTMDDTYSIVNNPLLRDLSGWGQLFTQGYFGDRSYYRPLVNITYWFEFQLFGLTPFFYYLDNYIIHLFNAILVLLIARRLLKNDNSAFLVSLFFIIHPVHWEAVSNISGRAILLSGFFSLLTIFAFLNAYQKSSWQWLVVSIISFALGLLCKESTGVVPAILAAYIWFNDADRKSIKNLVLYMLPFAIVIICYIVGRKLLGMTEMVPWRSFDQALLGFVSFLNSVLTHLRLFIWPIDLHFDRSQPMFLSWQESKVMLTIFVWAVLISWLLIVRKHLDGIDKLCLSWFAIDFLPVSQLVTTIGVSPGVLSTAEHFLYMPSVPFIILLVKYGAIIYARYIKHQRILNILIAGHAVFFLILLVEQNLYASNELIMMERSLETAPGNARLHASVGLIYALDKNFKTAQYHFEKAVNADPLTARYRISLGKSLCDQQQWGRCLHQYMSIQEPGNFKDLLNQNSQYPLMHLQEKQQRLEDLDYIEWFALGVYYAKTGDMEKAIHAFEKTLIVKPNHQPSLYNLVSLYQAKGDKIKASIYSELVQGLADEELSNR